MARTSVLVISFIVMCSGHGIAQPGPVPSPWSYGPSLSIFYNNGEIDIGTPTAAGTLGPGWVNASSGYAVNGVAISGAIGSQLANRFYASPNGMSGTPVFRSIANGDLPSSLAIPGTLSVAGATSLVNVAISGTLSVMGTVSGAGFTTYLASPPCIGCTTPGTIAATTFTTGTAVITPASGLSVGVTETQNLSGTSASYSANIVTIISDVSNIGAGFLNGLAVDYHYGGGASQGGRQAILGKFTLGSATNSANTNHNYVGMTGEAEGVANDNGTNTGAGAVGSLFGMNPFGRLQSGATNWLEVTGGEANCAINSGASAKLKFCWSIAELSTDAVHGAVADSALAIGAQAGAVGLNTGILFTNQNGQFPIISSGTAINFEAGTVATVIDASALTIGVDLLKSTVATITGIGGFYASGTDMISFASSGTHSTAGFQDSSTSPYGMVLNGTYSTASWYATSKPDFHYAGTTTCVVTGSIAVLINGAAKAIPYC